MDHGDRRRFVFLYHLLFTGPMPKRLPVYQVLQRDAGDHWSGIPDRLHRQYQAVLECLGLFRPVRQHKGTDLPSFHAVMVRAFFPDLSIGRFYEKNNPKKIKQKWISISVLSLDPMLLTPG